MKPIGGSEIIYNNILKYVKNIDDINLILSVCDFNLLNPNKPNVLLQELSYDQQNVMLMNNSEFVKAIDYFVYVSHWQYEKFRYIFKIPEKKSIIIKNAIDPIIYKKREKQDKLKLIYTSTPWRGLNVLLKSFELLNRDDVELHIYSSVKIYGDAFSKQEEEKYKPLFDKAKNMKNVIYHGYDTNENIKKNLVTSNIFTYPCIFEETSCISAIEAGMSGCNIVCTNFGALYETCTEFADYVPYNSDLQYLSKIFSIKLNEVIDNYWREENQNKLKKQAEYFNTFYTWKKRTLEWEQFITSIKI